MSSEILLRGREEDIKYIQRHRLNMSYIVVDDEERNRASTIED